MSFIEVKDLCFSYDGEEGEHTEVLHKINMNIEKGEFVALLGHNGCGKSTIAKLFNGMYVPSSGKVMIDGIDTSVEETQIDVRRRVGLVQQNPDNQLVAGIVEEDVAFGPENLGVPQAEIRRRVDESLKTVGMYEYRDKPPYKLSGGQKQRVAIAGIIAMETECIVLDEPTAMLDPRGREEVMSTIEKLNKERNITIVLITHYMDEAVRSGRVIIMDSGTILTTGSPREVFRNVEFLKRHKLDVPQACELAYSLKSAGIDIGGYPLNTPEFISLAEQYLKNTTN
jgi:energy-coupling factor transport system ATP-binding protein